MWREGGREIGLQEEGDASRYEIQDMRYKIQDIETFICCGIVYVGLFYSIHKVVQIS